MTANEMTNRDAAQIAALPKSAVWSQLQSRGLLEGGAGLRSLTSERTEHTSSPAMSGGHPKRLSLGRPETACEEVRENMRKHTKHGSAAGVALTGGSGGGRAVWQDELRGGVVIPWPAAGGGTFAGDPPHTGALAGHAGRAVLVTACDRGQRQRGGRPNGVHLLRPESESGLDRWGGLRGGVVCGAHPFRAYDHRLDQRGGLPTGVRPAPARMQQGRPGSTGGSPCGIHHDRPHDHGLERGGLRNGIHPHQPEPDGLARRGGFPIGVHPASRPRFDQGLKSRGGRPSGVHLLRLAQ